MYLELNCSGKIKEGKVNHLIWKAGKQVCGFELSLAQVSVGLLKM
jgi:hypothetical protein